MEVTELRAMRLARSPEKAQLRLRVQVVSSSAVMRILSVGGTLLVLNRGVSF